MSWKVLNVLKSFWRQILYRFTFNPYFALFLFLFAIYLLTYTPDINSSDGLAMFATAESFVRRGVLDIEQIRWMGLQQGTYGLDGLLYSRKGIGVPLGLMPLTWLGLVSPWFGPVSVTLLFNAIVTALTAVVLLAYLQALGFTLRTGLIVSLTFGLTTLAWPYAKSLFSDPLAGLLLLLSAHILLKTAQRDIGLKSELTTAPARLWHFVQPLGYPFLAGLFLGWNIATRFAEAIFLPVFGLLLLYYLYQNAKETQNPPRSLHERPELLAYISQPMTATVGTIYKKFPMIVAFSLPILVISLSLIGFNISRYGAPFNTGYLPNETFSGLLWDGITGQLVSPGRGLLLYSPVLILSIWGMVPFFRRFRAEALVALSIIALHLLLYGKWFMWHGGYAWGPRFMIPTLPFWVIFLAPVVDKIFRSGDQQQENERHQSLVPPYRTVILRSLFFLLIALSFISQLLMVSLDFSTFQNSLLETGLPLFARQTFFNPRYAALIGAWTFISLDTLDLVWAWRGQINGWLLLGLVTNIIVAGLFLMRSLEMNYWRLRTDDSLSSNSSLISSPTAIQRARLLHLIPYLSTLAIMTFVLIYAHTLPAQPLQQAVTSLNEAVRADDAIITNDPAIAMPFAELYKGRAQVVGLNNGGFPLPDDITERLHKTIDRHPQIWWLPNWLPREESAIEQTLLARSLQARHDNFEGQRLLLFAQSPDLSVDSRPVEANFDHLIGLITMTARESAAPGTAYPIALGWQVRASLSEDYHVFIHLVDHEGQLVAQTDGQPANWSRPTSTWEDGELIMDRHGLWIPKETVPGDYRLLVGLYSPATGQRLRLLDESDSFSFPVRIE